MWTNLQECVMDIEQGQVIALFSTKLPLGPFLFKKQTNVAIKYKKNYPLEYRSFLF